MDEKLIKIITIKKNICRLDCIKNKIDVAIILRKSINLHKECCQFPRKFNIGVTVYGLQL